MQKGFINLKDKNIYKPLSLTKDMQFFNTSDTTQRASFKEALLEGQAPNYGLWMVNRDEVPKLPHSILKGMGNMRYSEIALHVLNPFLDMDIPKTKLEEMLHDAYDERIIPTSIQQVDKRRNIMWLTEGPTYSFKDYAARFFGRALSYFLTIDGLQRVVLTATSGDTGGAVSDALHRLPNVHVVVFYPEGEISGEQRRQMTTLKNNVFAFAVNGDFNTCQDLSKKLLADKRFAERVFGDKDRFTSANSISLGRLLPQVVYPFFGYSRIDAGGRPMIASVPSGNFGDIMGTVIAREMGLPISKIVCGVNENREFVDFMKTGKYKVEKTKSNPSSAMNVNHPSNLARLVSFYDGQMVDIRGEDGSMIEAGHINKMPDLNEMNADIFAVSISDATTYRTMKRVYDGHGIILEPHGAVGWAAFEAYHGCKDAALIYETADPGKFPKEVKKATGVLPETPPKIKQQATMQERTYRISSEPEITKKGSVSSKEQAEEAKQKIAKLFS